MNDNKIIELYNQGFSIKYISNVYFKYKNRNSKPIFINGVKCYPAKIYTKNQCLLYIHQVIYSYIINKDSFLVNKELPENCSGMQGGTINEH